MSLRKRDVVGRRIVRIEQSREMTNGGPRKDIARIVLDNGSHIYFSVHEVPDASEYVVEAHMGRLSG